MPLQVQSQLNPTEHHQLHPDLLRSKFIARIWPWPHAYGSHTVPFWPLFPLQVSTLSHKSENWSHQNLALPYYILPPPVLASTTNICSIVVQFFLAYCTFHIFSSPKKCFPRICWRNETHLKLVFSLSYHYSSFQGLPYLTTWCLIRLPPLPNAHTHTTYHGGTSCDKLKLNSKNHGILQDQIHYPPSVPFTAIFVILRLLVRVRSPNQIPAGNLVPTFLWKPPGCKSCLIDWQVWRRGQQSLGGLVVLEGKGPWWDD